MLKWHSDYAQPIAVRLTRPDWKKPLILDFEGLVARLGEGEADRIWTALYVHGETVDRAGTRYVRMVPLIEKE